MEALASASLAEKPDLLVRAYRTFLEASQLTASELRTLIDSPYSLSGHEANRAEVRVLLSELAKVHESLTPANREAVLDSLRADLRAKLLPTESHARERQEANHTDVLLLPLEGSLRSSSPFGHAQVLAGNRNFLFDIDGVGSFDLPRANWQVPSALAASYLKHSWIVPGGDWVLVQRLKSSDQTPESYEWRPAHRGVSDALRPRLTGDHLKLLQPGTFLRFSLDGSRAAASKENYVLTIFPLGRRSGEEVTQRTVARTFLAIAPDGERVWSVGNWPNQDWSGDMFGQGEPAPNGKTHRLEQQLPRVLQVSPTDTADRVVGIHQAQDGVRAFELDTNSRQVTRSTLVGWPGWTVFDERGRYYVQSVQKPSGFDIHVYSMKTMTVVASGQWIGKLEGVSISPDGKKLLLSGTEVETEPSKSRPDPYWLGLYDIETLVRDSARGITNAEVPQ